MTGQKDAIQDTARQILSLPFQDDDVSTTFGDHLRELSVNSDARSLPMSPTQAKVFLDVLERLSGGDHHLSHLQREDLKLGTEVLLEESQRTNIRVEDFKVRVNNNRGDVSYAAIERLRDEKAILDSFFPDRSDATLNEDQRVEYLKMQHDWSKRSDDLDKITDLMTSLTRKLGIAIDPPTPSI